MNKYKYNKQAGALQDAFEQRADIAPSSNSLSMVPPPMRTQRMITSFEDQAVITGEHLLPAELLGNIAHGTAQAAPESRRIRRGHADRNQTQELTQTDGRDTTPPRGRYDMFFYTIEDGQRALLVSKNGEMQIIEGPKRLWRWGKTLRPMQNYVAHPGEFLIVRYRNGQQTHLQGPAHVWFDPREHMAITKEEALPISAKEAVVVYAEDDDNNVDKRLVFGPATFVPKPGEWLHTFSWHGSAGGDAYKKVPNALIFQKLWLMPDQMYHDVTDVRTADDAVLTIRLMLFFELKDIEKMLVTSHDPIGDFINAATSDIIEFMSRHDFDSFKKNTEKLNDLSTYKQLTSRGAQCGYDIGKVVYRGYGAPQSLQQMHDQAIESRTRLKLQRATEEQTQELNDFKLERSIVREGQSRAEAREANVHDLEIQRQRQMAQIDHQRHLQNLSLERDTANRSQAREQHAADLEVERLHLTQLAELGVDLTSYLTQHRADQVIELRDQNQSGASLHLHSGHDLPNQ